jgi:RNA polymerase sigma-70 factor (ECF subfamily)
MTPLPFIADDRPPPAGPLRALPTGPAQHDPGFAALFDAHALPLLRYCARRVGLDVAEDVVAETFTTAIERHGRRGLDGIDVVPWLYGIATNLLRRHRRNEVRWYRAAERAAADPVGGPRSVTHSHADEAAERIDAGILARHLAGALAAMPARDRDVLLLLAWAGLDQAEIAQALGVPVGTVRSRLHRARQRLRGAAPATTAVRPAEPEGQIS